MARPSHTEPDDAASWIARDNPPAAGRVAARIKQATEQLADHPESGRSGRVPGTRELVVAGLPYIVVYRIRRGRIYIIRVLHTSRRWSQRLS